MLTRLLGSRKQKIISGNRIYLRYPRRSDWKSWAALRQESRPYLVPWEPTWSARSLARNSFRSRLLQYKRDARNDVGHAFFIFRKENDQLIGSITLSNIRRGVAQTGTIGYWTGQPFARQGYMCEAIKTLLPELFSFYGLRRIEAACLVNNEPSAGLLKKIGFSLEGHARQYLCINGVWQDHLLFSFLKDDPLTESESCASRIG